MPLQILIKAFKYKVQEEFEKYFSKLKKHGLLFINLTCQAIYLQFFFDINSNIVEADKKRKCCFYNKKH